MTKAHVPRRPTRCLVTGATGYIGGRLVPRLLDAGFSVRCLVRDPSRLRDMAWRDEVEIVRGDVTARSQVADALDGTAVAFYLVHSLAAAGFEETDRAAARVWSPYRQSIVSGASSRPGDPAATRCACTPLSLR